MSEITKEIAEAARAKLGDKRAKEIEALLGAVADAIKPVLQEFRQRLIALEARDDFQDRGVWKEGLLARTNHGVTHEGSYWICQRATMARPGTNADWRLAVKRGRDAKGA